MISNTQVKEFFLMFPKEARQKCMEQVLVFAVKKIKKKFKGMITLDDLIKMNDDRIIENQTPRFKCFDENQQVKAVIGFGPGNGKENIEFTQFPLKAENRRTQSSDFNHVQMNLHKPKILRGKPLAERNKNDSEVLKLADDFLKNPFANSIIKSKQNKTNNKYTSYY
jgi:hypothetical protein